MTESRRPVLFPSMFIDHERSCSGRQNLKGLEEFDDAVLLVWRQRLEGEASGFRLAVVSLDRLTQCREQTVMKKRRFVRGAPELAREEFRVAREKARRARLLI